MRQPSAVQYYAHTLPNRPPAAWEPLEDHLQRVAQLAEVFAAEFGAGPWGKAAGLWHDLGKFSLEFQSMLLDQNGFEAHLEQYPGKVDHSTAGAQHAAHLVPGLGQILAYCIAGHHSGLADRTGSADLASRLSKTIPNWSGASKHLLEAPPLPIPKLSVDSSNPHRGSFQLALWGRMLFSCLVDADFLATEEFASPDKSKQRPTNEISISTIRLQLDRYLDSFAAKCQPSAINCVRQEVLQSCRDAAQKPPGLFSLSVPTGGGKTFSSLAFALTHAEQHGLDRVICAIPFTSIIEQTADNYRKVFGDHAERVVLEHHSNLDPAKETPQSRLASENWDAPIVVTTNVQLFESLFAAGTSRCRKLHRLAGSVIILDEAQTLPVEYLQPCLAVLRELATDYRCTIVLCTATQPALDHRSNFPIGLPSVQEIIPQPAELAQRMRRVAASYVGERTDDELVTDLAQHSQFLCIVNTRPHAAKLYKLLCRGIAKDSRLFHLSTNMCGEHRSKVVTQIRQLLADQRPCRVVSTQLIEAGVDADFPVVYRALTGLDSIAQAAGRCNREGKLPSGHLTVFKPTDGKLHGYLRSTAETTAELLPDFPGLLSPEAVRRYFELHYWKQTGDNYWDKHRIMDCFPTPLQKMHFQYRTASNAFRFIETVGKPVIVPYGDGAQLIEELRSNGPSRDLLRKLQRFTVNVFEPIYNAMIGRDVEPFETGFAVLINSSCYDKRLGFQAEKMGYHEPESLIG